MKLLMALSIRWLLSGANYNFVYFPTTWPWAPVSWPYLQLLRLFFLPLTPHFFLVYCFLATIYFGFRRSLKSLIALGENALKHIALMGFYTFECFNYLLALFIWTLSGSSGKCCKKPTKYSLSAFWKRIVLFLNAIKYAFTNLRGFKVRERKFR